MNTIFRNFITTLRRFRLASSLNIIGLSVAFTAFLVIIMQVYYEYSFDTHAKDHSRIYRLNSHGKYLNNGQGVVVTPRPFKEIFSDVSSIEEITIMEMQWGKLYFTVEKNGVKVGFNESASDAYQNFPAFFDLKLVDGDFANFRDNNSLLIPRSLALKFFDTPYAAGKTLMAGTTNPKTIAAVFEDLPDNSQLQNQIYSFFPLDKGVDNWQQSNYLTYVRIAPNATKEETEVALNAVDFRKNWIDSVSLLAITDIYYEPVQYYGDDMMVKKGNKDTTNILLAIAILIIAIASINFINFSTSLAPLRMKSINTQKVLGSQTLTLRTALVCEAVGISLISYFLALFWVYCLEISPWQNITLSGISFAGNGDLVLLTGGLALLVGIIAGLYPAYFTTKFPPVLMLKGNFAMSKSGRTMRLVLVGFQYVVSIGLIIGAIFLQLQTNFLRTTDKGFNTEQIIVVTLGGEVRKNIQTLESKLKQNPTIADIGYCQFQMGRDNMVQGWGKQFSGSEDAQNFGAVLCSWNFPQIMGIKVVEGEALTETDVKNKNISLYYLFNETAHKKIGFSVGDRLDIGDSVWSEIRAVVRDFNFKTMRTSLDPTALVVTSAGNDWNASFNANAYIRTQGDPMVALNYVKNIVKEIDPTYPSDIYFYDESFEQLYERDLKTTSLVTFFSMIAILISLVGVFGLVVFETQYKRKEIGVRKIMGSTVGQILTIFNRKFIIIVAVCFVIAVPLAYIGVDAWLGGFAYRTPMFWWVFMVGGLVVFAITIITVNVQSYRAATENPVKSLKSE